MNHREILVTTLFENLSAEANRLAKVAAELDAEVAALAIEPSTMTPNHLQGLQSVDSLRQSLEAIATITRSAASNLPDTANIALARKGLAEGVKIQQVRDACLGTAAPQFPSNPNKAERLADPSIFVEA